MSLAAALRFAGAAGAAAIVCGCDVEGQVGETDPCGLCDDWLVAYYKLDETGGERLADASGNGHHGAARGAVALGPGRYSNAVILDGAGWIEIPHDPALDLSSFTLSAWIRPARLEGTAGIIAKGTAGSHTYYLGTSDTSLELGWSQGAVAFRGGALDVGVWTHVAATVDTGGTARLFVGGQQVQTSVATSLPAAGATPLGLGRMDEGDGSTMFRGALDEVRIYSKAFDKDNVPALGGPAANVPPVFTKLLQKTPPNPLVGKPVTFEVNVSDADRDPLGYSWSFGDGPGTSTSTPKVVHVFNAADTYVARVSVSDGHHPPVWSNPIPVVVGGSTTTIVLGLLAYWQFESAPGGVVMDQSGHMHDAQINEGATIVGGGFLRNAVHLDGATGSARVAAADDLTLAGELTIAAWIRPERLGPYGILRKEAPGAPGTDELMFGVEEDRLQIATGSNPASRFLAGHIEVQSSQHVAVTISRDWQVTLYIKGQSVGFTRGLVPVSARAGLVELGRLAAQDTQFVGLLDDVRIYDYALSPREVEQLTYPGPG
jgi:hypothetical protein